MRKSLFFLSAAALVLASCTSDELATQGTPKLAGTDSTAVGFEVYTPRTTTRGGYVGQIGNTELQAARAAGGGFGVFAYYTDNNDYDPQSQPNFMYNQFVGYGSSGRWEYEPIKYWPNEYGSDATSDDADRVSFFAYAPYVDVIPSTGKVIKSTTTSDEDKWGITGMTRNSAAGDPIVKYIASFDQDKSVDLLWGTVGAAKTQWDIVQSDATMTLDEGLPWLNVQRPREAATQAEAAQRVTFQFEHALAQLSINIDADVDEVGHSHANERDAKTRVWVRSVTFNGFAMKGALNLNNTEAGAKTAYWLDYNGTADLINGEAITVHDGLKDGKEGTDGAFASNEKTLGLNPQIIQSNADITNPGDPVSAEWAAAKLGVTKDAVSLFRKYNTSTQKYEASDAPVMVIPTGDEFDIEIVYDVETIDGQLSSYVSDCKTPGNSIENRVRKTVTFGGENSLKNGKHYTLNLHLGMNSVKLDASVSDWQEAEAVANPDLPLNVPAYAAATGATAVTVDLLATTTKYEFAMTGLYGGETVTAPSAVTAPFSAATNNAANTSGVALQSISIAENTTIKNKAGVVLTWKGASSNREVKLNFMQKAHVIGLGAGALSPGTAITLSSTAAGIEWTDVTLAIKKNGVVLASGTDYSVSSNVITLTTAAVAGDIYTITADGTDVPEETITVKCQ